jgi:hypothetical protein
VSETVDLFFEDFFAIIFLMGHTRRDNLKEYWSTDPFLAN